MRAQRLERSGDFEAAIELYSAALKSRPDEPELLAAVARLAEQIDDYATAGELWAKINILKAGAPEAADGLARALRELGRFDEAIEVLRSSLLMHPEESRLWNALGSTLAAAGRSGEALTFFDEALRLDGRFAVAAYNRGYAKYDLGRLSEAEGDFASARKLARKPEDVAAIELAQSLLMLAQGDLERGWGAYEARLSPHARKPMAFEGKGRRWTPAAPLSGKHLLAIAEQGLGDEIMFSNLIPDVLEDLGPDGRLSLAVDERLVALFQRSFPTVAVTAYETSRRGRGANRRVPVPSSPDYWTPLASLCRRYRRSVSAFPTTRGYVRPDETRVRHWRAWLGEGPPAVGVSWRSGKMSGTRRREYPPLDRWRALFNTPGVRFVDLQYDGSSDERAAIRGLGASELLEPPGIHLRQDIDDLGALCAAMDSIVSVGNATAALAGACGCNLAILVGPASWPQMGSDAYPWYPNARALAARAYGDWDAVLSEAASFVADSLRARRADPG